MMGAALAASAGSSSANFPVGVLLAVNVEWRHKTSVYFKL
jgi:hypothetical protein